MFYQKSVEYTARKFPNHLQPDILQQTLAPFSLRRRYRAFQALISLSIYSLLANFSAHFSVLKTALKSDHLGYKILGCGVVQEFPCRVFYLLPWHCALPFASPFPLLQLYRTVA
jgi:hypothetical protein